MRSLLAAAAEKHKIKPNTRALAQHLGGDWKANTLYTYAKGIRSINAEQMHALQTQLGIKL